VHSDLYHQRIAEDLTQIVLEAIENCRSGLLDVLQAAVAAPTLLCFGVNIKSLAFPI
jgi:hypothetical protein